MGRKKSTAVTSKVAEKENVAVGSVSPNPKSPPARMNVSVKNLEEELEAMSQKLKNITLEKENVEKVMHEQEAVIKEQQDKLQLQTKEREKLTEKVKQLQKVKEFKPALSNPLLDEDAMKQVMKENRVKRPSPAFVLWSSDNREQIRAENPNANTKEIMVILGERWKKLSEEEKLPYEQTYQKNKEEYLKIAAKERKENEGVKLVHDAKSRKSAMELYDQYLKYLKEAPKKKEKDAEKPKRPMTSYLAFCKQRSPALIAEKHKVPDIGKMLGEEWKKLDDAARAPYEEVAVACKAAYLEEMEAYNKKKAEQAELVEKEVKEQSEIDRAYGMYLLKEKENEAQVKKVMKVQEQELRVAKKKEKAEVVDPNKPKRPSTSYVLFGKEYRKKLQGVNFKETNALIAAKWKDMNENEKKPWVDEAAEAMEKYKQAMNVYKSTASTSSAAAEDDDHM